jgi:hypothetical protein
MRYTPPKRTPGPRARANNAAHKRDWLAILQRQRFACAGCGARSVPLQDAHLAGRPGSGACLGAWANAPELRVALCCADPARGTLGCHEKIDRDLDPELRDRLRWEAVQRLDDCIQPDLGDSAGDPAADPLDAIRALVRLAEERHIPPPGDQM